MTLSSKLDALEMGQKVERWPMASHQNHWEECFYISYVSWELHSLKIPWGCKEERGTDSKMAPQCPPASLSETDGVWQAISWQNPSPNLSVAMWFQGNLKHIFSPSSKRQLKDLCQCFPTGMGKEVWKSQYWKYTALATWIDSTSASHKKTLLALK